MIIFNFTGLKRAYWVPCVERKSDGAGLWFISIRWLNAEVVFYSIEMGAEFIKRFNRGIRNSNE